MALPSTDASTLTRALALVASMALVVGILAAGASGPAGAETGGAAAQEEQPQGEDGQPAETEEGEPEAVEPPPPAPPDEEVADGDAPTEEAPDDVIVDLPPPEEPVDEAQVAPVRRAVTAQLLAARRVATEAEIFRLERADELVRSEYLFVRAQHRLEQLRVEERRAARRLEAASDAMRERAASAFMRGPLAELDAVLQARDVNDFVRRFEMVKAVLDADNRTVADFRAARQQVSDHTRSVLGEFAGLGTVVAEARSSAREATEQAELAMLRVASLEAGSLVSVTGFVFPVAEPYSFIDTFGAPRMPGTEYEHFHQGTDIFAPSGTPLLACERGVVTRVGVDVLGGTKLWIVGVSGNRYYYAHLSGYAEGIGDGLVVEPGDVVGYVGDTGNARGTPPHLHFEIHPPGAGAVNPFPLLHVVSEASRARAAAA